MKKLLPILIALLFSACEEKTTINDDFQAKTKSILIEKMEQFGAHSGQVIVMDVKTGQIKALVGLEFVEDSMAYRQMDIFNQPDCSGLFCTMALTAILESGKAQLSDTIDTGNGILTIEEPFTIVSDHNWHRGGYGKLSLLKGFAYRSDVTTILALRKAFPDEASYHEMIKKMSINQPTNMKGLSPDSGMVYVDCNYLYAAMGHHKCSPIQLATFYNAIANDGVMVMPTLYEGRTKIINQQVASKATIDSVKRALRYTVTDGLGKRASLSSVDVAGQAGTVQSKSDSCYRVDFCGYFPADEPQYTILVCLKKEGTPASGGLMAGNVFMEVAGYVHGGERPFTEREREFCLNTFEAYLDVDSAMAKEKEEFYKLTLNQSDSNDEAAEDWYGKNIVHIDSVMRKSIDLVKQDKSKQLLDLLESERYNIYGHPNADTYNCYDFHTVYMLLYTKNIENNWEYYTKLAELGEFSRMQIEAVQSNWEEPHPLYKQVVEELLVIYMELGNEDKMAEMEALLEKIANSGVNVPAITE